MEVKSKLLKIISIITIFIMIMLIIMPTISYAATDTAKKVTLKTIEDIKNKIDESLYPGYKEKLIALKQENPNWNFTLYYTNLDWNTVLYNQTEGYHGRSLVQSKKGDWLCSNCGEKVYDNGGWMCASKQAVAYFLDVRNYLTQSYVFQFEKLSYSPDTYTISGIEKVLSGTFMFNKNIREYYNNSNYENMLFSEAIMEAAKLSGVSPYYLAARIRQEIGVNGSGSSSGKYTNYEGYFNFYNIGATSGTNPIANGLDFAKNKASAYLGPWNSPVKSIKGGAIWIAKNYIAVGQDTLYFQKFDVVSNGTLYYNHQYMQNIYAPRSEGYRTYLTYKNINLLDNNYNFIIPLYNNMPKIISKEPTGATNSIVNTNTTSNSNVTSNTSNNVTPVKKQPTSIKLSKTTKTLGIKESYTISKTVSPKGADTSGITYSSSNSKVASVNSSGKITAKKSGTATITVKTKNGKTAKIKITVKKAPTRVTLSARSRKIKRNKSYTVKARLPKGSAGAIKFTSGNSKIATVSSSGKITAKKKGTTYITAKTYNGKKARIKVIVK